ncbi:MAG TPA: hypothetical protein VEG68_03155 [Terriglobales bacterium]|nr:hypothetical protein [Terriglobales bacterium]
MSTKTSMDNGSEDPISVHHRIGRGTSHAVSPSAIAVTTSTIAAGISHDL